MSMTVSMMRNGSSTYPSGPPSGTSSIPTASGGMLSRLFGRGAGFLLDLAAYSIICENNAGQYFYCIKNKYYPDYAFDQPLCTERYGCTAARRSPPSSTGGNRDRIYISHDSTNKNCQVGDVFIVECG